MMDIEKQETNADCTYGYHPERHPRTPEQYRRMTIPNSLLVPSVALHLILDLLLEVFDEFSERESCSR